MIAKNHDSIAAVSPEEYREASSKSLVTVRAPNGSLVTGSLAPKKPRRRHFNAANVDRLTSGWTSTSQGPNYEVRQSLRVLRARSRNLANNDEYIKRFFNLLKQNVIGDKGISLLPDAKENGKPDKNANEQLRNAWRAWCRKGVCTMDGKLSFKDVQRLLLVGIARDGEAITRHIRGRSAGNDFNYALQLIEPDHLDETYERNLPGLRRIMMGIEFDQWHKVHVYYFLTRHPGEMYSATKSARRQPVAAGDITHTFVMERVNQLRGVPWIHAAMWRLNMLGGYEDAELVASRAESSKMGFFTTPDGEAPPGTESDDEESDDEEDKGNFIEKIEAGRFGILPQGYDFKTFDPQHPNASFKDFLKAMLRGVSAGINVGYNALANDLENVNYSSLRQGELNDRDAWRCIQDWYAGDELQPIYEKWLLMALTSNVLDLPVRKIENFLYPRWKPRGWAWVDPLKEVNANIKAIEFGLKSRQDVAAEQGRDVEDTFNELAEEKKLAAKLGISINQVTKNAKDNNDDDDENDQDGKTVQNGND